MNTTENGLDYYENLIFQYFSETISEKDLLILNEWIEISPENKYFFEQTREIWLAAKVVENSQGFDSTKGYLQFLSFIRKKQFTHTENRGKTFLFSFSRIAAVVLLAFGLGVLADNILSRVHFKSDLAQQQEIIVPLGSKSKIKLPDGTSVTLNAGSRLTYKTTYGKSKREVWLEGEGYFSVAKDKNKAFIVKTGYLDIQALGTEFNVKAYPNEKSIQTTLVEGSIKIDKNFFNASDKKTESSVILKPKEKYTYLINSDKDILSNIEDETLRMNKEKGKVDIISPKKSMIYKNIDPIPDISWKERRWIISEERLGDLAINLERRYDININFADEKLKDFRFTGTLQDESIEQVLKVISLSSPIVFNIQGKQVNFYKNDEFAKKYKGLYKSK